MPHARRSESHTNRIRSRILTTKSLGAQPTAAALFLIRKEPSLPVKWYNFERRDLPYEVQTRCKRGGRSTAR